MTFRRASQGRGVLLSNECKLSTSGLKGGIVSIISIDALITVIGKVEITSMKWYCLNNSRSGDFFVVPILLVK